MRGLLLTILLVVSLYGYEYDRLLLNAEAAVFPKLLLLSKTPQRLLVEGRIVFAIVYAPEDEEVAAELREKMIERSGGRIEPYRLEVKTVPFGQLRDESGFSAVMALHSDGTGYTETVEYAVSRKIPAFVYDIAYLNYGFLFSLNIEREAVIYFNAGEQKRYGLTFVDALYQIVRFYDDTRARNTLAFY